MFISKGSTSNNGGVPFLFKDILCRIACDPIFFLRIMTLSAKMNILLIVSATPPKLRTLILMGKNILLYASCVRLV